MCYFCILSRGGSYGEEDAKVVMVQILSVVAYCHLPLPLPRPRHPRATASTPCSPPRSRSAKGPHSWPIFTNEGAILSTARPGRPVDLAVVRPPAARWSGAAVRTSGPAGPLLPTVLVAVDRPNCCTVDLALWSDQPIFQLVFGARHVLERAVACFEGASLRPPSSPFIFCMVLGKTFRRTKNLPWQNGLIEESLEAAGMSGLEAGTKLFISNLDMRVSNDDIRELFTEIGELIRYAIHFDKNGNPSGSAEVIFARRTDAFQALKRYNNVQLDGRPMKIEIVGANAEIPMSARINVVGANVKKRTVVMAPGPNHSRGGFSGANRGSRQRGRGGSNIGRGGAVGGRGRSRGGGRGRGKGRKKTEKSADELDKELDSYHAEAMQT